ncbi:hypothetical protein [Peribacillus glennii]|uniref:Uncharacterized protein n=1 Tax=Peribacillus glennii TaxID=2303991 RepID=A0A372LFS3_9BACI|nr:hypothetical protein [Peribacillus glennii]RFU65107.1 hypothetical protein D0466_04130 [Peribacillus glennii]
MKKVILSIIFAILLATNFQPSVYAEPSSEQEIVNKQLSIVKKRKIPGYKFYQAYPIKFTGKKVPEIVVSSYGFETGTDFINKTLLEVFQYDSSEKKWRIVNKFTDSGKIYTYRALTYITKGKLLDDKKEQLVVGYIWGSDFSLTPIVYGSTDGKKIKPLIPDKELFLVHGLSHVDHRYVYKKGKFNRFKGNGADDRKVAGGAKHVLMLERKNGKSYISGNKNITMELGEKFSIVRKSKTDSTDYRMRFYIVPSVLPGKGGPLLNIGGSLKAVKPGKVEMGILTGDAYETVEVNFRIVK